MNDQTVFEEWAVVDLFGHQRLAGRVRERTIAGAPFLQIDVPEDGDLPARTLYQSPNSVYSIQPCSEELAVLVARSHRPAEISRWELPPELRKALRAADTERDPELDFEEEDDDAGE